MTKSRITVTMELKGWALMNPILLERGVAHGADHEEGQHVHEDQAGHGQHVRKPGLGQVRGEEHQAGQGAGLGRDGQTHEKLLAGDGGLHVEPGQAQGPAGHEQEGGHEAEGAEARKLPLVHHEARQWRQRATRSASESNCTPNSLVVLVSRAILPSRAVEQARAQDAQRRVLELALNGPDHSQEAQEQARGGEQVRQDVHALVTGQGLFLGHWLSRTFWGGLFAHGDCRLARADRFAHVDLHSIVIGQIEVNSGPELDEPEALAPAQDVAPARPNTRCAAR